MTSRKQAQSRTAYRSSGTVPLKDPHQKSGAKSFDGETSRYQTCGCPCTCKCTCPCTCPSSEKNLNNEDIASCRKDRHQGSVDKTISRYVTQDDKAINIDVTQDDKAISSVVTQDDKTISSDVTQDDKTISSDVTQNDKIISIAVTQDDKIISSDIRDRFIFCVDPLTLMDGLYSREIITEEDIDMVTARNDVRGRSAAATLLWNVVCNKGGDTNVKWVSPLIDCLCGQNIGLQHLAVYIRSLDNKSTPLEAILYQHRTLIPVAGSREDYLQGTPFTAEAETYLRDTASKDFVKTRAYEEGRRLLSKNFVVGIIGAVGDGKTILSQMVANAFLEEHKDFIPLVIKNPDDMKTFSCSDNNKYLLLIDDMFGIWTRTTKREIQHWPKHFDLLYLKKQLRQLALIFVMRNDVNQACSFILNKYLIFANQMRINLHENHYQLNEDEKMRILQYHFGDNTAHKIFEMVRDSSMKFGFPYISRICSSKSWKGHTVGFNTSLYEFLYSEFDIFWTEDRGKYVSLLLVFCAQRPLSEEDLTADDMKDQVAKINTALDEVAGKSIKLHDAFDSCTSLTGSFITYDEERRLLTDPVARAYLLHLSKRFPTIAIEHCSFDLLMDMVTTNQHESKYHVPIQPRFFTNLTARFINELRNKNYDVLFHQAFLDPRFVVEYVKQDVSKLLFNTKLTMNLTTYDENDEGHFIHYLCLLGYMEMLKIMIKHSEIMVRNLFEVRTKNGLDFYALCALSAIDPIEKIDYLRSLKIGESQTFSMDTDQFICSAVRSDSVNIIQHVAKFVKVDSKRTYLHDACESNYDVPEIIQFLVDKGAMTNAVDKAGYTPLHLAVQRGKEATIARLIKFGADVNVKDSDKRLPIDITCSTNIGRLDIDAPRIVRHLVEAGSLINTKDTNGYTPLMQAKKNFHLQLAESIKNIESKKICSYKQSYPLQYAALYSNDLHTFKTVVDEHKDLIEEEEDDDGDTPIDKAFQTKYLSLDKVRILISECHSKCKPLIEKCQSAPVGLINFLFNKSVDGRMQWFHKRDLKQLRHLLLQSGELDVKNNRSFLHIACLYRELDVVKWLIDNGCITQVNGLDYDGHDPMYYSCISDKQPLDKVKLLTSVDGKFSKSYSKNRSLLHAVCELGEVDVVEWLIDHGCKSQLNDVDASGNDPIYYSCLSKKQSLDKVKLLLSVGGKFKDKTQKKLCINIARDQDEDGLVTYLKSVN